MSVIRRPLFTLAALTAVFASGFACEFGSSAGDRAIAGHCPERVCSGSTPSGLIFYGQTLYDDEADRLGPVARGGVFMLRFGVPDGEVVDWEVEVEPAGVLEVRRTGSRAMVVRGIGSGEAMIRIVDPVSGALYDRMPFRAVDIASVAVGNAKSARDYLVAGCSEMVGIDLHHDGGRAFDLEVEMSIDGQAVSELWDCYQVDVPVGVTELEFSVYAGAEAHLVTMPVITGDCLAITD